MKKINYWSITVLAALLLATAPVYAQFTTPGLASLQSPIIQPMDWMFGTDQVADVSIYNHRELMVSSGCDVNGDGYQDLLVGKRDYDYLYARDDNGRVWLFLGGSNGLSATPSLTFNPPYTNYYGFFGAQVACAGDVNGDSFQDIIIGMDNYDSAYSDEGAVFVYYGAAGGPATTPNWMARGNSTYAHFGLSLDSAGDVNGDGYDDIIVGNYENYSLAAPHAYVWHGGPSGLGDTGLPSNADWVATGPSGVQASWFGRMVRGIGDVNADGFDDILVGAHQYDGDVANQGAVFVWFGSSTGLGDPGTPANVDWMAVSDQASSYFGFSGDGVGDLNGDGSDDIAIGAYAYDDPETSEGKLFIWYGSGAGLGPNGNPGNADWSAEANTIAALGYVVRSAGDVNADGFADLLVTAPSYALDASGQSLPGAGAWWIWKGSADGLGENGMPANADMAGVGSQAGASLGRDDAGTADVNHDGAADIFVAAFAFDQPEVDEGVVFGYYSGNRIYLPVLLR